MLRYPFFYFSVSAFCCVVLWLRYMPVGCKTLCWGIPSLRHCLVILQQMQCSDVFLIPSFIIISFCFGFLLCCIEVHVYARWVWSFMLRYPFFKALLNHFTTDAVFQSIYNPNFIIVIFCYWLFAVCTVIGVYASWVWEWKICCIRWKYIVIKVYRFYSLSCMVYHKSL